MTMRYVTNINEMEFFMLKLVNALTLTDYIFSLNFGAKN